MYYERVAKAFELIEGKKDPICTNSLEDVLLRQKWRVGMKEWLVGLNCDTPVAYKLIQVLYYATMISFTIMEISILRLLFRKSRAETETTLM